MSRLTDGHPTTISFSAGTSAAAYLWEKTVTPPGVSGGGENDTTNMHNSIWRTRQPKVLKTLSNMSFDAQYDPAIYDEIVGMVNVNQQITVTFSDGSTLVFWGWLDEFTPGSCEEGTPPIASCTIIPSNLNDSDVETAPVYAPAA
jgi:hypothetical protein